MKIIGSILSIYLLLLSVYPCAAETCNDNADHCTMEIDARDSGDKNPCTPFCIDGCCLIHIYYQPSVFVFKVPSQYLVENSIFTFDLFTVTPIGSIWQPPRIC